MQSFILRALSLLLLAGVAASADEISVGPGGTYGKLCVALDNAKPGDVLLIDAAGDYAGESCTVGKNTLTLKGVNGRPKLDALGALPSGGSLLAITGSDTVLENLELANAKTPDGDGAALRLSGRNLTLRNLAVRDSDNGLVTSGAKKGKVLIEASEFFANGNGATAGVQVGIGAEQCLVMRFNWLHQPAGGSHILSLAEENEFHYNRILDESEGDSYWMIDIPLGGKAVLVGNVIQKGAKSKNPMLVSFGTKGAQSSNEFYAGFNTLISDNPGYGFFFFIGGAANPTGAIVNNLIQGLGLPTTGPAEKSFDIRGNITSDGATQEPSLQDFRPIPGSPLVDAGVPLEGDLADILTPRWQALGPACGQARNLDGLPDVGAFELGASLDSEDPNCKPAWDRITAEIVLPSKSHSEKGKLQGRVQLDGVAPEDGAIVQLTSSNPELLSLPESVTIPKGESEAKLEIEPGETNEPQLVVLEALFRERSKKTELLLGDAALDSLELESDSLAEGDTLHSNRVRLASKAPAGGTEVELSLTPSGALDVPKKLVVPAGETETAFSIKAKPTSKDVKVELTAAAKSGSSSRQVQLQSGGYLMALELSRTSIQGVGLIAGEVVLSAAAPQGGAEVTLKSSDPALLTLPSSVTISSGGYRASFEARTVANVVSLRDVIITANYRKQVKSSVTVQPPSAAGIASIAVPSSVSATGVYEGTVRLTSAAGAIGVAVSLNSSNPSAVEVPATVIVPNGSTSATFRITVRNLSLVSSVTISASHEGVVQSAPISLAGAPAISLSEISVGTPTVSAAGSYSGTVTLSGNAPAGGIAVSLASNNGTVTVPASVTVPAGSSSVGFTYTVGSFTSAATVTLTSSYSGVNRTATVTLSPSVALSAISVSSPTVSAAGSYSGTVTLSGNAPAGSIAVSLASNNGTVTVPASVTVPAGSSSVGFTYTVGSFTSTATVTLTSSYSGVNRTATVTLSPSVALSAISVSSPTVSAAGSYSGTVTLSGSAPAGGIAVSLASNNGTITVPASVTVPAGSSSVGFAYTVGSFSSAASVTLTASYSGVNRTATVTLSPSVALSAISVSSPTVSAAGSYSGTVTLSGNAPAGGIAVSLASNNGTVTVPASITVPAGSSSVGFAYTVGSFSSAASVTLTASYSGVNRTATVTLSPAVALSAISVGTPTVSAAGSYSGTVTLSGSAPAGGIAVSLASNNGTVTVPASVTVPSGSSSVGFTYTVGSFTSAASVTLTASYSGVNRTATVTLSPAVALSAISVGTPTVSAAGSYSGTVTLSGSAPAGGIAVSLASNNGTVTVPASVTVPAGSSSVGFTYTVGSFTSAASVTLTASYSGVNRTATVTLSPAVALSAISVGTPTVSAAGSYSGTVTLSGSAPAGGIAVSLASNNGTVTVPASVTVPAGSSSVGFTYTVGSFTSAATVTLTASYSGVNRTATVTLSPAVALSAISVGTPTVSAAGSYSGTVTLSGSAPAGGIAVSLASNNGTVTVPASVTVPSGSSSVGFTYTVGSFTSAASVTLTATRNSVTRTATVTLNPTASLPSVSLVHLPALVLSAGTYTTNRVVLSAPAPAGGVTVSMNTTDPRYAQVPATLSIPAGATEANFTLVVVRPQATFQVFVRAQVTGPAVSGPVYAATLWLAR